MPISSHQVQAFVAWLPNQNFNKPFLMLALASLLPTIQSCCRRLSTGYHHPDMQAYNCLTDVLVKEFIASSMRYTSTIVLNSPAYKYLASMEDKTCHIEVNYQACSPSTVGVEVSSTPLTTGDGGGKDVVGAPSLLCSVLSSQQCQWEPCMQQVLTAGPEKGCQLGHASGPLRREMARYVHLYLIPDTCSIPTKHAIVHLVKQGC